MQARRVWFIFLLYYVRSDRIDRATIRENDRFGNIGIDIFGDLNGLTDLDAVF